MCPCLRPPPVTPCTQRGCQMTLQIIRLPIGTCDIPTLFPLTPNLTPLTSTQDYVNPEKAWPHISGLAAVTARAGFSLLPRCQLLTGTCVKPCHFSVFTRTFQQPAAVSGAHVHVIEHCQHVDTVLDSGIPAFTRAAAGHSAVQADSVSRVHERCGVVAGRQRRPRQHAGRRAAAGRHIRPRSCELLVSRLHRRRAQRCSAHSPRRQRQCKQQRFPWSARSGRGCRSSTACNPRSKQPSASCSPGREQQPCWPCSDATAAPGGQACLAGGATSLACSSTILAHGVPGPWCLGTAGIR